MITGTALHAVLGVDEPLNYALLARAVREKVRENDRLDWKRFIVWDEVAKDIAALANAQGGLLVYGVAQDNTTSAAAQLMPVDISDAAERRFRQMLDSSRVVPAVAGVQVVPLPAPGATTTGALAVSVPQSPSAPHLIGEPSRFAAPRRAGTITEWMTEAQLERAYAARATGAVEGEAELERLIEQAEEKLDDNGVPWLVAAVRPLLPSELDPPDRKTAASAVSLGARIGARMLPSSGGPFRPRRPLAVADDAALANPRPGLRRWVVRDPQRLHLEMHHDGRLVLAAPASGTSADSDAEPYGWLEEYAIAGFAVDVVAAATAHATTRHISSGLVAWIAVHSVDDRPLALAAYEKAGPYIINHLTQPPWTNAVTQFERFSVPIPTTDAASANPEAPLPGVADAISSGISHQFGFTPATIAGAATTQA